MDNNMICFRLILTTILLRFSVDASPLVGGSSLLSSASAPYGTSKCDAVRTYFESQGFQATEIPKEPVLSRELKTCGGISSGGEVCCSAEMELKMQTKAREKHEKATKDTLQRLQNVLHTRAVRFHNFFNDLLVTSKKSFHEMFKKTYGILYEQNSYVFLELFKELEKYYAKGLVDLDDVMDTFFNTLYQKMFTVLNSQYKFDSKYLECVGHHMKEMRPFGDVPQKLGVQIKRSFIATRAFSQALQVATDVVRNMQQLKPTPECAAALTRMTVCPSCSGIPGNVLACNNMCESVMKGCLAQHAALDQEWNLFVEAVDKVADRLLGPFNIEMLVRPINLKISEAIMNFQESSSDVSQRVFTGCGRPVLGRRKRRSSSQEDHDDRDDKELEQETLDFEADAAGDDERSPTAVILDKLVKEIKQKIRDSRQFWIYLPYELCSQGLTVAPSNTKDCWNGTHVGEYIYPPPSNGDTNLNPEVRVAGPRPTLVRDQLYALTTITNRLRSAFNGHDVDWIDSEEVYSSGSGSGSGPDDPITDDEDGFREEGSGYEPGPGPVVPEIAKGKEHEEPLPPRVDIIEPKHNAGSAKQSDKGAPSLDGPNGTSSTPGSTASTARKMTLTRALTTYLLPVVIAWFGGCLTEWV